jgi:hypothetical protein
MLIPYRVADVEEHLHLNDPGPYKLSEPCYEPSITAVVEVITAVEQAKAAA